MTNRSRALFFAEYVMSAVRNPVSELNGESAADQDSVSTASGAAVRCAPQDCESAGAASLMSLVPVAVRQGAGHRVPTHRKSEVRIGFIPLTDCASVVMASVLKLDEKYGIKIIASKEASWAAVRDKLVNGELDAAHVLYGLVYGVHMGIGGPKKDMAVLMTLNNNGQAITLSNQLKDKGVTDGASLASLMKKEKREYTFAQTFPTGTHAMWLYYWLCRQRHQSDERCEGNYRAAASMVANMRVGNMDGFCVGEPWNAARSSTRSVLRQSPRKTSGPITPKRYSAPPTNSTKSTRTRRVR